MPWLSQSLQGVLREIKSVKQERGTGWRRWFESDGLDLVVWLDGSGKVTGFQLCYDFGQGEQALTWREGTGFAHSNVDAGDETPLKNRTPILVPPEGGVPWSRLEREFDARSESLEPALRQLVHRSLAGRAGDSAPPSTPPR
ncbi:MAG: hypothetical protein HY736_13250 [Verrucomicrobia bacterium]|nr:hypothetical protein [Verrucomicrobiota bacterium]